MSELDDMFLREFDEQELTPAQRERFESELAAMTKTQTNGTAPETALANRIEQPLSMQRTVSEIVGMKSAVQEIMKAVMHDGEHYGKIPGCGDKPALLKAGAETLGVTFRLAAISKTTMSDLGNGHREYFVETQMIHIPTNEVWAMGLGSCSTMESKYRYRESRRKCPACGAEAIIKGKDFNNTGRPTGWVCFGKKGGCGAKFDDGNQAIEGQALGRVENPDIADQYNTCLKMAKKRSHVDGIISATAASDIFTQDIEELLDRDPAPVAASKSTAGNANAPAAPTVDELLEKLLTVYAAANQEWANKTIGDAEAFARKRAVAAKAKFSAEFVAELIKVAEAKMKEAAAVE